MKETKILLSDREIPTHWYNIQADMPNPLKPPLSPITGEPATPDELSAIFPMEIIKQEVSRAFYRDTGRSASVIWTLEAITCI